MSGPTNEQTPIFDLRAEITISASPYDVYAVVCDLPRSSEWSPECTGGEWVSGEPATVGAVFRGSNLRGDDIVPQAPVVRGRWVTESEVVAAEPGRTFRWAMRTRSGQRQESVWAYDIEPRPGGSLLTHHFRMGEPTEGIREIVAGMSTTEQQAFILAWGAKVGEDLAATVRRVKQVVEKG